MLRRLEIDSSPIQGPRIYVNFINPYIYSFPILTSKVSSRAERVKYSKNSKKYLKNVYRKRFESRSGWIFVIVVVHIQCSKLFKAWSVQCCLWYCAR